MFPHHLCQAYVLLYKATQNAAVGQALAEMVDFACDTLYDADYRCFKTIVEKGGTRVGTRQSFGHDCEISYLLQNAASLLGDNALAAKVDNVCKQVLIQVLEHDYDAWGSLYNGCDLATGEREKSHVCGPRQKASPPCCMAMN